LKITIGVYEKGTI